MADCDLFGRVPVVEKRPRGRPPHKKTLESQRLVDWLRAVGWSQPQIAAALGISDKTLRRHYFATVAGRFEGAARRQAAAPEDGS